jgi:hypothetical protein
MTESELSARYAALLRLRDRIIEWDNTSPQDGEDGLILAKLRNLYKKRTRAYAADGGQGHCPIC